MATTNHEKYLAGVPLTPELAELKAGRLPEFEPYAPPAPASAATQPLMDPERELTREEGIALREIRQAPGWAVLQRLLERATIAHTKAAIQLSQDDPLGSGPELNQMWVVVKLWKQTIAELNWAVAVEMQRIEESHAVETQSAVEGA
jgi:hypothetical protein